MITSYQWTISTMITLTSYLVIFLSLQLIFYTILLQIITLVPVCAFFAANISPTIILRNQYLISTSRKEGQGGCIRIVNTRGEWRFYGGKEDVLNKKQVKVGQISKFTFYLEGDSTGWKLHEYELYPLDVPETTEAQNNVVICVVFYENQHLSKLHQDLSSALARAYSTKLTPVVKGKQMDGDGDKRDVEEVKVLKISKPEKVQKTTRGRRGDASNSNLSSQHSSSASEVSRRYVTRSQKSTENVKSVRTQQAITTAVGRYELRSITRESKNTTKVISKVGLDVGDPFNSVLRRPRTVSPITRGKEGKGWGSRFAKTVTSVSRLTDALDKRVEKSVEAANKDVDVVVDLKRYTPVEKEVAKVLLQISLEGMVATSKTSDKSKETATNFTPLRNAQKPQGRFHDTPKNEDVFVESLLTARREKKLQEGRHLNLDESPEYSRRSRSQRDLHVGQSSKQEGQGDRGGPFNKVVRRPRSVHPITRGEVVTPSTAYMSWGTRAKFVRREAYKDVDVEYDDADKDAAKTLVLMSNHAYTENSCPQLE